MADRAIPGWRAIRRIVAMPTLLIALSMAQPFPAAAQEQSYPGGFDRKQVEGIEEIVRQYLIENPEVLVEALTAYQQNQRVAKELRQQQVLESRSAALYEDPDAPAVGNLDGDVTIVEFFDYRCPYCRKVADTLRETIESDGKIRLVMKEFPILGEQSFRAARAALAAVKQGKYEAFHFALMTKSGDMSMPHIRKIARDIGLDVDQLETDMEAADIEAMLRRNHELARSLDITGTPAFVIGDTVVPGAIDAKTFERLIAKARSQGS